MSQNRPPPAYMEYAANTLTDFRFRMLTPCQRGMLWTMKMECWVNHHIPGNPKSLATALCFDEEEVAKAWPWILPFFEESKGWLICPEIEDYRQHLNQRRQRQSDGGKIGAKISNSKRSPPTTKDGGHGFS